MQILRLAPLALLIAAAAPPAPPEVKSPAEIVAEAPASAWVPVSADALLVMDVAPSAAPSGSRGAARRVIIQLLPPPFAPGHLANIRTLARAHWWDGTSINRVQDNYVVQWGDATEKKPLPPGMQTVAEAEYVVPNWCGGHLCPPLGPIGSPSNAADRIYSLSSGFREGWPVAADGRNLWPVHCYGMVGVGRNLSPDTGTGAELYVVIGQAPRHLDRNIALVGRVVEGVEYLSSLSRGTEALGFYATERERTPILSIRLASDLPAAEQPRFEFLSTESDSFMRYADARANRRDAFFIRPAGGADVCNVPVPVRRVSTPKP